MPLPMEETYHNMGMPHPFMPSASLDSYDDNSFLAGAVDKIAQELSGTQFHLRIVDDEDEIEIVRNHQALATLQKPQPTKTGKGVLTGMDLKLVTGYHLCLMGEAFWLLDKRLKIGGATTFIDMLLPEFMNPIIRNGEIVEYIYRLPEKEVRIDPLDVVHFKLPDPRKWARGHAPVQSIRYAIDTYKEADLVALRKLQNNAVPPGTLESNQPIAETERKKLGEQWRQSQGGAKNAGKVPVMPYGLHFNKTQESNAEMQHNEGKKVNREEILSRYGVGPEILGLTDSQTRANAEAAIFVFMKFGVSFIIKKVADTLTNDYLPAFPGVEGMEFAFKDPVPENDETKRANGAALFQAGGLTPDEFRKMFGMEPLGIPGVSDVPYAPISMLPVGDSPPDLSLAA